jgi:ribosomal protein L3 glutamine methyltransferase
MNNIRSTTETPATVADWIRWTERELDGADVYFGHGTDNALDEAAWLVGGALQLSPDELDAKLDETPTPAQAAAIRTLLERRVSTRLPTAYLLNQAWFAGLPFYVDERVLVPRSLTAEFIHDQFAPWIEAGRVQRILDLCTGSGCMAIACAYAFPQATVDAADISEPALAVAAINVQHHRLQDRVRLVQSDLYRALAGERYDVIVTNPPYVGSTEMNDLPAEYRHEPGIALASGDDGLDAIIGILAGAAAHLRPGGILVAEVGNSHEPLQQAFPDVPFVWLTTETGDESVFLLTAAELATHAKLFAKARR